MMIKVEHDFLAISWHLICAYLSFSRLSQSDANGAKKVQKGHNEAKRVNQALCRGAI